MRQIAELQVLTVEARQECIGVRMLIGGSRAINPLVFLSDVAIVHGADTEDERIIWVGQHAWVGEDQVEGVLRSFQQEAALVSAAPDTKAHLVIEGQMAG